MLKLPFARKAPPQQSQLTVIHRDGLHRRVLHQTRQWIESPHWSRDGNWLVFNGGGRLYRVAADGSGSPVQLDTGRIGDCNNDHLFSPDGATLYFTAGGCIYALPVAGGPVRKVSTDHVLGKSVQYYLHGVSPDGQQLCCTGVLPDGQLAIYALPTAGGAGSRLTHRAGAVDGPEYSPDGEWIYFNGELDARRRGDSQLYRMRCDGSGIETVLRDERVNWFPHLSPDGRHLAWLSYAPGTEGHPASRDVLLRLMPVAGGATRDLVAFLGGQGSLNSNSWAPDSQWLAYVAYPRDAS